MFTRKSISRLLFVLLAVLLMSGAASASPLADAISTSFTYQGRLTDGGVPANGSYDLEFKLYDALIGGTQVGSTISQPDVTVTNGLFTVQLDFGNVFDGTALYLEIGVRPGGSIDPHTLLTPRQPLSATPYAIHAMQSGNADLLDGAHAGNAAGNIPLNNGTVNTNLNADLLDGLDASAFALAPQNVVVVAKSGGNYATIMGALNSITDASASNPYLIYVAPGVYIEQVIMKEYVDIQGSGELTTKIKFAGTATTDSGTVVGANNAELRFLTVENTGGAAYAIAIYNSSASPRLTHVTATVSGGTSQSIAVSNSSSSSPTMTNVTASATGTGNQSFSVAVQNADSCSPTMTNIIATASGGTYNYGVNDLNSSSPKMTNVIVTLSGGAYNYGVNDGNSSSPTMTDMTIIVAGELSMYNAASNGVNNYTSSSPIMTNVTITVSGNSTNRGLLNQYSSSPVMTNVTVRASGGPNNFGILNSHASAPTITNCIITGSDGDINYGIYNDDSETANMRVNNSQISGSTGSIKNSTNVSMFVGASQLSGGASDAGGGILTCAGVYDENYVFYASTCP